MAAALRAIPAYEKTFFVLMTSQGLRGDAAKAHAVGFDAYLSKPIRPSRLIDVIKELCQPSTVPKKLVTQHTVKEREAAHRHRILVAEDDKVNQIVAVKLLERLGMRADVVGNGRDAVNAVSEGDYDVVLMDCHMPEMDGFEATRTIRNLPNGKKAIPIVALTASAMAVDHRACIASGMNKVVTKPVNAAALQQALSEFLPSDADQNTPEVTVS